MENEEKKLIKSIKRATILSGVGMGLLLGVIMGLSASEVVQTIFGVLTALLGAFLGFDKRNYAGMQDDEYQKEKYNNLFTGLRAGYFGIAVVVGIFSGMWVRTHEIMSLSVEQRVKQWTDAGYDTTYAQKLVAYQRLAINPTTGEAGPLTALQTITQGVLFSAEDRATLCGVIDPVKWDDDWDKATDAMNALKIAPLTQLLLAIENNAPANNRFEFLWGLRVIVCEMSSRETRFCELGTDPQKWQNDNDTSTIFIEIAKLGPESQKNVLQALSNFVCQLEKD